MSENKVFLKFLIASHGASFLATGMVKFGISLWVYQQTQSITLFSIMALSGFVPGILLSSISGTLVDRYNQKKVLLGCQLVLITSLLFIAVLFPILHNSLWWLFGLIVVFSSVESFSWPAFSVAVTKLATKESLAKYNGATETCVAISFFTAPTLAGFLFQFIDIHELLFVSVPFLLFSMLCVMQLDVSHTRITRSKDNSEPLLREVFTGFQFVAGHKQLRSLLLLFCFINFIAAIHMVLLVPFTLSLMSEASAGLARGMEGLGMLLGGVLLAILGTSRNNYSAIVWGGWIFCILLLFMAISNPLAIMILLFLAGVNLSYVNGCSQTEWQKYTPVEIQGRVFALRRMMAWLSLPLGYLSAPVLVGYSAKVLQSQSEWSQYFEHGQNPEYRFTLFMVSVVAISILVLIKTYLAISEMAKKKFITSEL